MLASSQSREHVYGVLLSFCRQPQDVLGPHIQATSRLPFRSSYQDLVQLNHRDGLELRGALLCSLSEFCETRFHLGNAVLPTPLFLPDGSSVRHEALGARGGQPIEVPFFALMDWPRRCHLVEVAEVACVMGPNRELLEPPYLL